MEKERTLNKYLSEKSSAATWYRVKMQNWTPKLKNRSSHQILQTLTAVLHSQLNSRCAEMRLEWRLCTKCHSPPTCNFQLYSPRPLSTNKVKSATIICTNVIKLYFISANVLKLEWWPSRHAQRLRNFNETKNCIAHLRAFYNIGRLQFLPRWKLGCAVISVDSA